MARPTKYNQKLLEAAKDYLINFEAQGDAVPTIAGLSLVLDVRRETLHEWAKDEDKAELSNTLAKIKQKQESILIGKGLKGEFNSTITKLMLCNHGYSEKQQQEISGPNGSPIESKWSVEFVNASPES